MIRYIRQSDMLKCPFAIMDPSHYREVDGTCKCDDPEHRIMMCSDWGYELEHFKDIPLRLTLTPQQLLVLNEAINQVIHLEDEDTLVGNRLSDAIDNLALVWAQIYNVE